MKPKEETKLKTAAKSEKRSKKKDEKAYNTIAKTFDFAKLEYFRSLFRDLCKHALIDRIYADRDPADVLYAISILRKLFKAVEYLAKNNINTSIILYDDELFKKKYYSRGQNELEDWNAFPRSLSLKEYKNPYKVFRHFFKVKSHNDWKFDLMDVVRQALSNKPQTIYTDMVEFLTNILKLLEAAHLIDIREIHHVDGRLRQPH